MHIKIWDLIKITLVLVYVAHMEDAAEKLGVSIDTMILFTKFLESR